MTSVEIATILVKFLTKKVISNDDVQELEVKLSQIKHFDGLLMENLILPRFVAVLDEKITTRSDDLELGSNILKSLRLLVTKSTITNAVVYKTLSIVILSKFYDPAKNIIINHDETLQTEAFLCVAALSACLAASTVESVFIKKNMTFIGQLVFMCSTCLEGDGNLELKTAALTCLQKVLQLDTDESDIVLRSQISGLIFVFTPKMCGTFLRINFSDAKLRLKKPALEALGKLLVLLFESSSPIEEAEIRPSDILKLMEKTSEVKVDVLGEGIRQKEDKLKYMQTTEKTEEWTKAAAEKLNPNLAKISSLLAVPDIHPELRDFCKKITQKCSKYFSMIVFYEILLILDEDAQLDAKIVRDSFESHMKRLPRLIHRKNEVELKVGLDLLQGYVRFFTRRDPIFITPLFTETLMNNLIVLLEIIPPKNLLDESLEFILSETDFLTFTETFDENVFTCLKNPVLQGPICNAALELLDTNTSNEVLLLLLKLSPDMPDLLEILLEPVHWNLQVKGEGDIEELRFNIIHICLTVRLVAELARNEVDFFRILPKLLEKAGSSNCAIHETALNSLRMLARRFNSTVEDLMSKNSDFISHYVAQKLRRSADSLEILNAYLELNPKVNDHFIHQLIEEMLELLTGDADTTSQVLKIILIAIKKFEKIPEQTPAEKPQKDLYEMWMNILEPPQLPELEDLNLEDGDETEKVPEDEEPDEEPETPRNELIRKIIRSCLDLMSSSNRTHKLYTISIMKRCLEILDDNKEFLPVIHQIWTPLSLQFKENNLLVVNRTFDLLLLMARRSKTFIQKRTATDVLPFILRTIKSSGKDNLEDTGSFASTLTQSYKLQIQIFENVGLLVQDIEVHEKDLDYILEAVSPLLSNAQPKGVQEAVRCLLSHLYVFDPTAVTVKFKDYQF